MLPQLVHPYPDIKLALLNRLQLEVLLRVETKLLKVFLGGLVELAALLPFLLLLYVLL